MSLSPFLPFGFSSTLSFTTSIITRLCISRHLSLTTSSSAYRSDCPSSTTISSSTSTSCSCSRARPRMDEIHYQKGDVILTPFVILLTIHKSLAPDLVSSHWSKHLSKPCPIAYSGPSNVEHISHLSKWQRGICWFAESPKIQGVIVTLNLLSVFRYLVIRHYFPSPESVELMFFILAVFGDILLMADPVKNYLRRKTPLPQNDESSYMRRATRSLANAGFRFQGVSEQQATEWERRWRSMDGILMEKFTIYNLEPPKEEEMGMRCSVELSFFENGYVRLLGVAHLKDENDCVACALGNR